MAKPDSNKGKPAAVVDFPARPTGRIRCADGSMAYWLPPGVTVDVENIAP